MTFTGDRSLYRPKFPIRFITAASLFDGHDAAINIMRRLLQSQGAEVVHLGHNRSVQEVVEAAISEDVQGVAISSYQGGHMEYFKYLLEMLRAEGRSDIKVFGGGGGVIVPSEIEELEAYGVTKIFSPSDGQHMGLEGMINSLIEACDVQLSSTQPSSLDQLLNGDHRDLARVITAIESSALNLDLEGALTGVVPTKRSVVVGITGTGGSGKSSLTDELIRRFRLDQDDQLRIAVLAIDPTKRRAGGALLGDRIRMNAIDSDQIFFRSIATRGSTSEVPPQIPAIVDVCKAAGFDLILVETPGIGQGDAAITEIADLSLYVMTPEFGSASQLEKIEMLDFADLIAINKFDRRGAKDALRMVERQWYRNHQSGQTRSVEAPVFGTIASRFNDDGTTALYQYIRDAATKLGMHTTTPRLRTVDTKTSQDSSPVLPVERVRYLAEITHAVRSYHRETEAQRTAIRTASHVEATLELLKQNDSEELPSSLLELAHSSTSRVKSESDRLIREFEAVRAEVVQQRLVDRTKVDGTGGAKVSLSGTAVSRIALPRFTDDADLYSWLRLENLPGHFPFTAGVFPLKRDNEDPARMFAGEGDPTRTNRRFHMLAEGQPATRLSTAFDSVTLYGRDPSTAPDVYGKVGTSGVSIATIDDMAELYSGFDLCDPKTSVSMTINGPAPTILAMFFNTAIDQQTAEFVQENGRQPNEVEMSEIRAKTLRSVRGTVQADILKEDQGQNTCIFSTEFSLAVMADIQEYFIEHSVHNFYSVSISGYHIAEAGANPITQLAFTLANGFTYVESYLSRGMDIDAFAPNLSFFFSNGMDPEYTVIGRVARRIWAIVLRDRYGANERSCRLKYHIQTSGRSLHAQEIAFNDIRTSLQALCAIYDNANSLHTNAYDEAITTPTAESVRRALAIQLIINKEWGLAKNENPLQGSFIVEELTELVEQAVLEELDRISERGGVLGAMETGYQRGKIQDDSMLYEHAKHDGSLPIIGVNTFTSEPGSEITAKVELSRATEEEKQLQLQRLAQFKKLHEKERGPALDRLKETVLSNGNVFEALMETVKHATLGEITQTLFEVGGVYRRST